MSELEKKVYNFLTTIPKGKVVTYKDIATYLGNPNLCRVVGNILHKNPDPIKYPCYKVVNSKGQLAKNFGDIGGINTQANRLLKDGIEVVDFKVDLEKFRYKINS